VEFQAEGSEVRMWGTLTDISLHGCYVEMSNTFPVGTKVNLVLKSCGIRIETPGTVRASYPALGMGIALREIAAEQEGHLKQLIAFLSGHNSVSHGGPVAETREKEENNVRSALATADPKALLDEIQQFFQNNHLLSRDEFHEIARRVCRS
jgi:hypothetical protein